MLRVLILGTTCVVAAFAASAVLAATESENFNSPPVGWGQNQNINAGIGTNFGYSATTNAGGAAGEAGGYFPRTQTAAYYADTTIGSLSSASTLTASGKISFENINSDNGIDLGWFDKNDSPNKMDFIGITVNNGVSLRASARPTGSGNSTNGGVEFNLPNTVGNPRKWNFTISYSPGTGTLDVAFLDPNGVNPPRTAQIPAIPLGTYDLNAFGLTTSGQHGSNDPLLGARLFIDDITYTVGEVPEPASALLFVISALAMGVTSRRRR